LRVRRIHTCFILQVATNNVDIYVCKIYISNILKARLVKKNYRNLFFRLNANLRLTKKTQDTYSLQQSNKNDGGKIIDIGKIRILIVTI
jgi:hypothetical protein